MTELGRKIKKARRQQWELHQRIVTAARGLIPALLDAGRTHSAKELQELFFQLDVAEEEITSAVSAASPEEAIEELTRVMAKMMSE